MPGLGIGSLVASSSGDVVRVGPGRESPEAWVGRSSASKVVLIVFLDLLIYVYE